MKVTTKTIKSQVTVFLFQQMETVTRASSSKILDTGMARCIGQTDVSIKVTG